MDLFGEKIGTKRYRGKILKSGINNDGTYDKEIENIYTLRERNDRVVNSKLYASELIKRNRISNQDELYKNDIYGLYYRNKNIYFEEKKNDLLRISDNLKQDYIHFYEKALNKGYSQSLAEKISSNKTDKNKIMFLDEHKREYPF